MRPRLVLGLRRREELDATVGMFAEKITRDADADSNLVQPLEEERPRKLGRHLRSPRRALRDFAPTFPPSQKRESICRDLKKFRERAPLGQEDHIFQGSRNASVAFAGVCRGDQEREIVDCHIGQSSMERAIDLNAGRILEKRLVVRQAGQ